MAPKPSRNHSARRYSVSSTINQLASILLPRSGNISYWVRLWHHSRNYNLSGVVTLACTDHYRRYWLTIKVALAGAVLLPLLVCKAPAGSELTLVLAEATVTFTVTVQEPLAGIDAPVSKLTS